MGSYVDESIVKGEFIVHRGANHWINFISLRSFFSLFILPIIDNWTDEYAVTNKRIIIKVGLIRRRTLEINVNKVESILVEQSIIGRILGYGNISVVGTGGTCETYLDISKPIIFRKKFQEVQNQQI